MIHGTVTVFAPLVMLMAAPLAAQAGWTRLYPPVAPPARADGMMATHEASGVTLLLFGTNNGTQVNDVWRLTGSTWTQAMGGAPPWRLYGAITYDVARQRIVLFGGSNGSADLQDTWEWNGISWSNPSPPVRPPARRHAAFGHDPMRGVSVLFGGANTAILQDTWEWNGTTWTQRVAPSPPVAREQSALVFDPVTRRMLLHGGVAFGPQSIPIPLDDTWTWDGVAWQQQFPLTPPPYRLAAAMVSDRHRQRVVLLGGIYADPRTWEWNGSQWQADWSPSPAPRFRFPMAYDGAARRTIVHGGYVGISGGAYLVTDTWTRQTPLPAAVAPFGAGCAGTAGLPQLTGEPYELPWLGDTIHHRAGPLAAGSAGALFVAGFAPAVPTSLAFLGMPGCDLLVAPDVIEFGPANGGLARWTFQVPSTIALAGAQFFQQAFPFDAGLNPLGLSATNGLTATLGIR
jgi:hypothetical protein